MESAGVDAGENMLGVAGSTPPAAKAIFAAPSQRKGDIPSHRTSSEIQPHNFISEPSTKGLDISTRR